MDKMFSKFGLEEENNFLAKPYSEKHGEGYFLSDDPVQLAAGLLMNNLKNASGMIVIVRNDELAFVLKIFDNNNVAFIDFDKRDFPEAGRIFDSEQLDYFGVLIDQGEAPDKRRQYKVLSQDITIIDA